ncbi:5-hydroxytryptamine receptor 1E [Trichomycterus rosablanca]|uniref:5-hydroxytryptamine receptor 1E n=1 Tax=Trichomycterus rosablanca TaxID=2290929 RepID=UPI002F34F3C5
MELYLTESSGALPPTNCSHINSSNQGLITMAKERLAVASLLGLLTVSTAVMNAAVIAAILNTRKLRLPANYLICSLAITDFLVAVLVMPPSILYIVMTTWSLGEVVCEVWLSVDMTCCTCSILHLCVIALDRYWAITKAVAYARKRTPRRAIIMVTGVWVASVFISAPPLFWRRRQAVRECVIEHDQLGYSIYSTFGAFYIPMTLILILYYRIYNAAKSLYQKRGSSRHLNDSLNHFRGDLSTSDQGVELEKLNSPDERNQLWSARERKAARTLGLILGAFIICWLPFFIKELLLALKVMRPMPLVSDFLTWLGYLNSLINPLLYTSFNDDFKQAFKKLLSCKGHT